MFIDSVKLIGILLAVIVMYIITGIICNVLIDGEPFEWKRFWVGIIKALAACASLIVLAFVASSDLIDLSSIGFNPKTFISSGILLYGSKLLKNVSKLIGIGGGQIIQKTEDENSSIDAALDNLSDKIVDKKKEVIKDVINSYQATGNEAVVFEEIEPEETDYNPNSVG